MKEPFTLLAELFLFEPRIIVDKINIQSYKHTVDKYR